MEKLWHMPKGYTGFSSAQPGGTAAVSTIPRVCNLPPSWWAQERAPHGDRGASGAW